MLEFPTYLFPFLFFSLFFSFSWPALACETDLIPPHNSSDICKTGPETSSAPAASTMNGVFRASEKPAVLPTSLCLSQTASLFLFRSRSSPFLLYFFFLQKRPQGGDALRQPDIHGRSLQESRTTATTKLPSTNTQQAASLRHDKVILAFAASDAAEATLRRRVDRFPWVQQAAWCSRFWPCSAWLKYIASVGRRSLRLGEGVLHASAASRLYCLLFRVS